MMLGNPAAVIFVASEPNGTPCGSASIPNDLHTPCMAVTISTLSCRPS